MHRVRGGGPEHTEMACTYRTAPDPKETGWPRGIPYIIGNEGCERFSYYGMKAILWVYLVHLYTTQAGLTRQLAENEATVVVHLFVAGVYALPMIGAIVADRLAGKYPTILYLSLVYCLGHLALALFEGNVQGTYLGLALIALGSGGIKPCVSAHVGDQFGPGNWHRLQSVFQAFYFIINFGSFFSTLLVPWIKETYGWSVAFGIPGVLMGIATLVFWMGRCTFVHVPPRPGGRLGLLDAASSIFLFLTVGSLFYTKDQPLFVILAASFVSLSVGLLLFSWRQRLHPDDGFLAVLGYALWARVTGRELPPLSSAEAAPRSVGSAASGLAEHPFWGAAVRRFGVEAAEGPIAVLRVLSVFLFVSVFWSLFDQHASSWVQQAKSMNLEVDLPFVGRMRLLPEQMAALNPILVMLLIPATRFGLYPLIERMGVRATPLRRMTVGMFVTALSFVVVAWLQERIDTEGPARVSVLWQLLPYTILTLGEVMVSITGLEFAYTQAPPRMKSTIMGFWLLTVALGSVLTASVFGSLQAEVQAGRMTLSGFFWLFGAMMAVAGGLFAILARRYRYRDYTGAEASG